MSKVEFSDVTLTYPGRDGRQDVHALRGLNLRVEPGESVAIIGPSGCGKSSTLLMAAGLLRPTSGAVLVDGTPVERERRQTALILQGQSLLPWKTVERNVELGLLLRHVPRQERRRRVSWALEQVDLTDFARVYPAELSGGMAQRAAIARSLALDCDLLMMDEPLSALDALLREQIQDVMLRLWRERAYAQIIVTHSIEEAAFLGQRVVVMAPRPGRVVDVIDNPGMGEAGYRSSSEFFGLCTRLRAALQASMEAGGARHERD